jgi:thiamine biosynthesis lipoprotein
MQNAMTIFSRAFTRRAFLSLPAVLPLAAVGGARNKEFRFQYDHVLGTSLDLVVWTESPDAATRAEAAALDEIQRLASVLDTRNPGSDISRLNAADSPVRSRDLAEVLAAYDRWAGRTGGIISVRPQGPGTPLNVDALGKAYIIDRAASAARACDPAIEGILLNIGGDIVIRGRACDIAVTDPRAPHDNATPMTWVRLEDAAIATSGTYARGAHLLDPRTGKPAALASSATVVAPDAVTANALATTLCLTGTEEGLRLVERTTGAHALRVAREGTVARTAGFSGFERPRSVGVAAPGDWPAGYELTIALTLTEGQPQFGGGGGRGGFGGRRRIERPYVAVWVESTSGALVRILAFWAGKAKYFDELSSFWNLAGRNQNLLYSVARATREPGRYQLIWDGLDNDRKPAAPGTYRIVVETNQEHGTYAKRAGTLACAGAPASLVLPATANFEAVSIQYGPKTSPA